MAEEKKNVAPSKNINAVKKETKKLGFFKRIGKWFREMKSELTKVMWPTKKTVVNNTLVALVVMPLSFGASIRPLRRLSRPSPLSQGNGYGGRCKVVCDTHILRL